MTNDRARLAKKRIEMQQQKTHEQTWLKTIIFHFVKTNEIFFPICEDQCDQIGQFSGPLGNFLKPLATINLSKSPTFWGIFYKGVKIHHFSSEIIFRQLL